MGIQNTTINYIYLHKFSKLHLLIAWKVHWVTVRSVTVLL